MGFVSTEGGWIECCPVLGGREINLTNGGSRTNRVDDDLTKIAIEYIENGSIGPDGSFTDNAVPRFRVQTAGWSKETWGWFLNLDQARNLHNCTYNANIEDFTTFDPVKKPFVYPTWVLEEIYRKGLVKKANKELFLEALQRRQLEETPKVMESTISETESTEDNKEAISDSLIASIDDLVDPRKELVSTRKKKR